MNLMGQAMVTDKLADKLPGQLAAGPRWRYDWMAGQLAAVKSQELMGRSRLTTYFELAALR